MEMYETYRLLASRITLWRWQLLLDEFLDRYAEDSGSGVLSFL